MLRVRYRIIITGRVLGGGGCWWDIFFSHYMTKSETKRKKRKLNIYTINRKVGTRAGGQWNKRHDGTFLG